MIKQEQSDPSPAPMVVVIVTYNSADVIEDCLDSLLASDGADLRVIVVDNKSPDNSIETVTAWAMRHSVVTDDAECGSTKTPKRDLPWLTLLRSSVNKGFAGGVNEGLRWALPHKEIDLFWILNPDCMVEPQTAKAFLDCAARSGEFSLMGGRIIYSGLDEIIQSDGGCIKTGAMCVNVNQGIPTKEAMRVDASKMDFISGANMVASRRFIEATGLMDESYFLYFEEVDWAARRGNLPLILSQEAQIRHHGGTSIGTGSYKREATPFSHYFNFRNRVYFARKHRRGEMAVVYALSLARIAKLFLRGKSKESFSAASGLLQLPPPKAVLEGIQSDSRELAFSRNRGSNAEKL